MIGRLCARTGRHRVGGRALTPPKIGRFRGVGITAGLALLVGCAAAPPRISPWDAIEPFDDTPPTEPLELPDYPEFRIGDDAVTTDAAGGQTLQIFREAAIANTEIAWEHGDQVAELRTAYNALARAGQAEHELAELRAATIDEERRAHLWARLTDWIVMGLLAITAAR